MMNEMMAKIMSRWIRKLLMCRTKNPPSHRMISTTARIRNIWDLLSFVEIVAFLANVHRS